MLKCIPVGVLLFAMYSSLSAATITVEPWQPVFKGIDLATGRQEATMAGEFNHRTVCFRVDLTDPDVVLFTTPKCTNCGGFDTLAENTSLFLERNRLQVAVNGGFYSSSTGPNDVPLGTPEDVRGLAISLGQIISPADDSTRAATLLFTTNNQPLIVPNNNPGTNTDGIFTAISGDRVLLTNGVVAVVPIPNDRDPRTAIGFSEDRRYLYMMTLDGRQAGWSDGADWYNTALWLQRFGAYNAINVDGGGSTTAVMANCAGSSVRLNRSSFVAATGRERIIGHNFGVYAPPLPGALKDLTVIPEATTATITWRTEQPATTQIEYGPTTNYGNATPLDARLLRNHVGTLSGLIVGSNYFFRAISTSAGMTSVYACQFSTTAGSLTTTPLFDLTNTWTYTSNNLDGVNWRARNYDDSGWLGSGPGLLYALENSAFVAPRNTQLPAFGTTIARTFYFRTRFNYGGSTSGASLLFSGHIDDGAVFYLNGTEIHRLRLPAAPTPITFATVATATPCAGTQQSGDAATNCPDIIVVSGNLVTNLLQGENVLAVEVHNGSSGNDLVFGTSLSVRRSVSAAPRLNLWVEGTDATLYWNGEGFRLQASSDLTSTNNWIDVPGPVTRSPFITTSDATQFYRLRN